MAIRFIFSNGLSFRYLLNDTATARTWLDMMGKVNPAGMFRMKENHRHGFADLDEIKSNIGLLAAVCKGLRMPELDLSANNWLDWQKNLNAIHVTFPGILKSGVNSKLAHTANLLIHWLEYELSNLFDQAEHYLFNLDFNHNKKIYAMSQKIPAEELGNFTTDIHFGALNLHYIYIGRHFLEMVNANDLICPSGHFRPQGYFNPTCAINFSEPVSQRELDNKMREFYRIRGGRHFFGLDYSDERMAKGFFKLGEMEDLRQYSLSDRAYIREALRHAYVTHWEIG